MRIQAHIRGLAASIKPHAKLSKSLELIRKRPIGRPLAFMIALNNIFSKEGYCVDFSAQDPNINRMARISK